MAETHFPYSRYLIDQFGGKTYKVVISSGLTCPTRDGSIDKGGCAFCDVRGSSSFHSKKGRGNEVLEQIEARIDPIHKRFGAQKYLAYFQSYTNTYSDVEYLRSIYEQALSHPKISGLCIGTRPDCLPDAVIDLLQEIAQKTYVSLELGVQSFEDPSLEWLERGHSGQCSIDAFQKLKARAPHVQTCAHLIFGSPPDSPHAARDAALLLSELGVTGAKLHQLMILENTKLAEIFRANPFKTLSLAQYSEVVYQFLEHLSPEIYVERLCANATHPEECLAPEWSRGRWEPHNEIRKYLEQRNCIQGSKLGRSLITNAGIDPDETGFQSSPSLVTPKSASPT